MEIKTYRDPLLLSIDLTLQRTKALVLWEMETNKQELKTLVKHIPSLNRDEVTAEVNELVELGLVARVVHAHRKPQLIEYALTNRGAQLLKCLRKMIHVGIEIMMDYGMSEYLEQEGYIEKVEEMELDEEIDIG